MNSQISSGAQSVRSLRVRQEAPGSGGQAFDRQRADRDPDQTKAGVTDRGRHPANLPVPTFAKNQANPGRGHVLAEPDRHGPGPKAGWFFDEFDIDRLAWTVRQAEPSSKLIQRFFCRNPFDLSEIGFGVIEAGIGEAMCEPTVVGQQQEAFAIEIEPADRIDAGCVNIVRKCRAALGIGEFREDAVGFVEKDMSRWLVIGLVRIDRPHRAGDSRGAGTAMFGRVTARKSGHW